MDRKLKIPKKIELYIKEDYFPDHYLLDLDFGHDVLELEEGKILFIVGQSGAGKSMLTQAILDERFDGVLKKSINLNNLNNNRFFEDYHQGNYKLTFNEKIKRFFSEVYSILKNSNKEGEVILARALSNYASPSEDDSCLLYNKKDNEPY